jgi:hypothetical protein
MKRPENSHWTEGRLSEMVEGLSCFPCLHKIITI